ncbi:MAG TPA: helix-turn-helix transcriptional regulator [Myxococcaceae bacterium]|nr:helix-turn-helix transcriptional regulator [Myxococcaceae bacterium]
MHHHSFVLSELAELGLNARARRDFRQRVLFRLAPVIPHELGLFHTAPPVPPGMDPVTSGFSAHAERRLRARWSSHAPVPGACRPRAEALMAPEGARLFARLTGELHPPTAALLLPIQHTGRVRAWLVLGRCASEFSEAELELARLLSPVLSLGDGHALELHEAVGTPLSARESEIFEYLCRGFRNEDIAEALGTSPHTVRNQLVRLYRKTGVCTRSELVGLASTAVRRATH